ncbi:hypothetical protein CRUP_025650, partial [Coryphaenoides rupestris]
MKRKLDHGPEVRSFPSGKKPCKGTEYPSPTGIVPCPATPTTFGHIRTANSQGQQRRRITSIPTTGSPRMASEHFSVKIAEPELGRAGSTPASAPSVTLTAKRNIRKELSTRRPVMSWSGPEKLLALDELIDSCEPTQVKHMMQVIEPQFQRDFISLLPKEPTMGPLAGLQRTVTLRSFTSFTSMSDGEWGSRAASASTASTLTSLGGTSSRRGSGETSIAVDNEASIREIKDALVEVGEKYRKAMVSNAQLDNEKNNLMYQVDTLKDSLTELEELLAESRREYEEKAKDHEREKHAHSILQFQFNVMKETLKLSEELLNDIRQLRLKQDGFIREISDLQETVEWKDKKDL